MVTSNSFCHWPQLLALSGSTGPPQKTHLMLVVEGGFSQSGPGLTVGSRSKSVGSACSFNDVKRGRTDVESHAAIYGITQSAACRCVVDGKSLEAHVAVCIAGAVEVGKGLSVSSRGRCVQSIVDQVGISLESGRRVDRRNRSASKRQRGAVPIPLLEKSRGSALGGATSVGDFSSNRRSRRGWIISDNLRGSSAVDARRVQRQIRNGGEVQCLRQSTWEGKPEQGCGVEVHYDYLRVVTSVYKSDWLVVEPPER